MKVELTEERKKAIHDALQVLIRRSDLYSLKVVDKLFAKYTEKGGVITTLEEGVLGYGLTVCHGDGLKTAVVREVALNAWSSAPAHSIHFYNRMPKKYEKLINKKMEA